MSSGRPTGCCRSWTRLPRFAWSVHVPAGDQPAAVPAVVDELGDESSVPRSVGACGRPGATALVCDLRAVGGPGRLRVGGAPGRVEYPDPVRAVGRDRPDSGG